MSSSPECPICHKRLENWNARLICPTKALIQYGDQIKQRNHYEEYRNSEQCKTYLYPPFRITTDPVGDGRTEIHQLGYQEDQPINVSRLLLILSEPLSLPWDNESEVLNTLKLYLTFA
jgi:hypothetical protein